MEAERWMELHMAKKWRDKDISPERTKVWRKPEAERRVAVVYYLSLNGKLQHPHFMELRLSSPRGLFLRGKCKSGKWDFWELMKWIMILSCFSVYSQMCLNAWIPSEEKALLLCILGLQKGRNFQLIFSFSLFLSFFHLIIVFLLVHWKLKF